METADLIGYASDPAFGLNEKMQVSGWNAAAQALLGYTRAETDGMACSQVLQAFYLTGESLCSVMCEGRACITSGKKWGIENCRIRHKNGDMISVGISSLVLPHEARTIGSPDPVAVIFLRKAGKDIENFASDVPLRIFTLGKLGLAGAAGGLDIGNWKRKRAAVVLKCLVSQLDRPVHRERLIDWLWPEATAETGWQRLKVTISYLRGALRKGGVSGDVIETVGQSYLLRSSSVWVDADSFATLVTAGWDLLKAGNIDEAHLRFEQAEDLYRGDFFEDEPYAEWCAVERERLREFYLEMLAGMTRCCMHSGKYVEAARVCRTALSADPCRENFIRSLMQSMARLDRRDWARAHFISWQRSLEQQYGLTPTEETLTAYQNLVDSTGGHQGFAAAV